MTLCCGSDTRQKNTWERREEIDIETALTTSQPLRQNESMAAASIAVRVIYSLFTSVQHRSRSKNESSHMKVLNSQQRFAYYKKLSIQNLTDDAQINQLG